MLKYYKQIDVLKGLAIIAVILQHSVSGNNNFINTSFGLFCATQAVPVFIVIMGFNAYIYFERKTGDTLKDIYSKIYLLSKFKRIVLPFLLFDFVAFIIIFFKPTYS